MSNDTKYEIVMFENGRRIGGVAGIGRNKGKWESFCYSKRTAQRWLKYCRDTAGPGQTYIISEY